MRKKKNNESNQILILMEKIRETTESNKEMEA
jgi:hypothetical protein